MVIRHNTVSRNHARVEWDPDEDRPFIVDLGSANGLELDGRPVDQRAHLIGGNQVMVGDVPVSFEFKEENNLDTSSSELKAFLLDEADDEVALFSEDKKAEAGRVESQEDLAELFLRFAEEGRSGTLGLEGTPLAEVVISQGKVVRVVDGDGEGPDALTRILRRNGAIYRFTRRMRIEETNYFLDLKEFVRSVTLGQPTKRTARHALESQVDEDDLSSTEAGKLPERPADEGEEE